MYKVFYRLLNGEKAESPFLLVEAKTAAEAKRKAHAQIDGIEVYKVVPYESFLTN